MGSSLVSETHLSIALFKCLYLENLLLNAIFEFNKSIIGISVPYLLDREEA